MKNILRQYWQMTKSFILSFFRNKMALFFVLVLPLIFLVIFGFLFAGEEDRENIAGVYFETEVDIRDDNYIQEIIEDREGLSYRKVSSVEEGKNLIRNLEVDMLFLVRERELEVFYNPARIDDNPALQQQASGISAELDKRRAGIEELMVVNLKSVEGSGRDTGDLKFMFPGLIALGLASAGLFVFSEVFMIYREKKVLKRMTASPMKKNVFLLSLMSSRIPGALLSSLLVLLMGQFLFGITFNINWLLFLPYLLVGMIVMMGLGALITLFARTAESAAQAASILLTIMIFFSGIYFPVEFLPSYFERLSVILPLSYIARGLRYTMRVRRMELSIFLLETVILLSISVVMIYIVNYKVKWV